MEGLTLSKVFLKNMPRYIPDCPLSNNFLKFTVMFLSDFPIRLLLVRNSPDNYLNASNKKSYKTMRNLLQCIY